ncbi:MAG: hypothetical protein IJ079_06780 [Lachnospiraceae bacterium]|nr:hypothetical protein [Lachnospiraceae bacterium]
MDVRLEQAIMNRQNIPSLRLSVRRILSCNGMSLYENPCFNRVLDRLHDSDSLMIDFFDGMDLTLDSDGLEQCRDIIKGYIGSDLTDGYIEYAKAEDGKIEAMNTQIKLLSESPASDLKKIIKEPEIYCRNDLDYADTLFELCKTELQARSVFNLVRNAFRRGVERFLEIIWSIPFRVRIKRLKRQIELEI